MVPYFKNWEDINFENSGKYKDVDGYLYSHLDNLGHTALDFENRTNDDNVDVKALPDAAYKIYTANDELLHYSWRVNDHHHWQYRRNNGLTKIAVHTDDGDLQILRVNEGQMETAYTVNAAYIKHNFNTTLISGINYYDDQVDFKSYIDRLMIVIGKAVLPLCLAMGMPVFLLNIVSEKEKRLIENMKINGMNMTYYWVSTYVFNYLFYLGVILVYFIFGKYVFQLTLFANTDSKIILVILNGWGMAQISFAFFISVFINKA